MAYSRYVVEGCVTVYFTAGFTLVTCIYSQDCFVLSSHIL